MMRKNHQRQQQLHCNLLHNRAHQSPPQIQTTTARSQFQIHPLPLHPPTLTANGSTPLDESNT